MNNAERDAYLVAYYDNEADANKKMSIANAIAGLAMIIMWVLYLTDVFTVGSIYTYVVVRIAFPIAALILFTPLLFAFRFKEKLRNRRYKYFVVFSFVAVIAALNIIIPKHALLGWALCIVMTNHYYNPRLGKVTFGIAIGLLLICLYAAMFIGEYDPNLLGEGIIVDGKIVWPESAVERFNMLHQMLLNGENRYIKVLGFYFFPRAIILFLIFYVCDTLNKRTNALLVREINVSGEQQKTKTELEVAKEIQLATLPTEFVTNEDVEIQAELKAAKEVGGDFYDYFILEDHRIAILIADVSGKGIPAAMLMMKSITCFKNYISLYQSPSQVLKAVNRILYEENEATMFVTCFLAIVDTKTGLVTFANAGHNPPIIGKNGAYRFLKCKSGFILGGMKEALVSDETFTLQHGESITLYTDGITEAMNVNREQYGEKRLLDLFNRKDYSCLIELHHTLKDDILEFVGDAEQSDDMTYITLRFHGDKNVFEEETFKGDIESIPEMLAFIKKFADDHVPDAGFTNNLLVVGDELLSNIVKYGYKDEGGDIFIRLLYNLHKKELIITFIDTGAAFNPFLSEGSALSGDISDRKPGGLGILIVKKLMSEYAYDRINKKNIVILKKKFSE